MSVGWLDGQVALVTGGASGLGRAVARRFVAEGARVAVLDKSAEKLAILKDELGDAIAVSQGDVTRIGDNERAVATAVQAFGKLDVFVANAGMWDLNTGLKQVDAERLDAAFDELFALNVKAAVLGAKAAVEALTTTQGAMIFTLSNAAFHPGGGGPLYTASKHALVGLVRQLAYELAPEIRVNGVAPGGMPTDIRSPSSLGSEERSVSMAEFDETMRQWSPLRIAPRPEDYAGHYVLLASRDNARTVTGAIHVCDAGAAVRGRDCDEAIATNISAGDVQP